MSPLIHADRMIGSVWRRRWLRDPPQLRKAESLWCAGVGCLITKKARHFCLARLPQWSHC